MPTGDRPPADGRRQATEPLLHRGACHRRPLAAPGHGHRVLLPLQLPRLLQLKMFTLLKHQIEGQRP